MEKVIKRKIIDWNKKSGSDNERISKRLEGRAQLADSIITENDSTRKVVPEPQKSTVPLLKIRKKIRDVYDEEDEEEDSVYIPFFNIRLIDDDEYEYEEKNITKDQKRTAETIRITKEQQAAGKLNVIMDTIVTAEKAGIPPKLTREDERLLHSAEYNIPKMRRKAIKQKITDPLKIEGEITEQQLQATVKAARNLQKEMPDNSFKGFTADEMIELDKEDDPAKMAEMILEKTGRKKPKQKNLAELAKAINEFEQMQPELKNRQEKE